MIQLRAHHLLCIRNFQGRGYSKGFVDNFYNIIERMGKEKVRIVRSVDAICGSCPFSDGSICAHKPDSEERLAMLDKEVIKKAGIDTRRVYSYQELKRMTERLRTSELCGDCDWKDLCE